MSGFTLLTLFLAPALEFAAGENNFEVQTGILGQFDSLENFDLEPTLGALGSVDSVFYIRNLLPSYFGNLLYRIHEDPSIKIQLLEAVSEPCRSHTDAWSRALLTNTTLVSNTWALQMIDAWPKIPAGILTGHTTVYGDFDECLGIRAEVKNAAATVDTFKGKYCSLILLPNINVSSTNSLVRSPREAVGLGAFLASQLYSTSGAACYPSTCSTEDVTTLLTNAVRMIPEVGEFITPTVTYCTTDDSPKLKARDIVMIAVLGLICLVCVAGTLVDLVIHDNSTGRDGCAIQALLAFSAYTNTKKWLNTNGGASGGENFGCMHGIRFLSTCWVVLDHTWTLVQFVNTTNIVDLKWMHESNWSLFSIINGSVAVDTFFTMSALLFSYNMLKALHKSKGVINIPMMYLHRFLRLTPTYALLVGIIATVFVYIRDGPQWDQVISNSQWCRDNWWNNLLYINNFMQEPGSAGVGMCHAESWYLANDMQFFLVSPLLVYPLYKWEKVGMGLLSLVSVASIAIPWIIHDQKGLLPTIMLPTRDMGTYFEDSYMKPWMRFGAYSVGLWAGFILFKTRNKRVKLPRLAVLFSWLASTASALLIIYGIIPWFDPEVEIPKGLNGFYAGTHRFAWGILISWIIFACSRGYGGPVNIFLSWNVFIPLGRLTFCVYLMSYFLQLAFHMSLRQPIHYDAYSYTHYFFAHMVLTLLIGFVCYITMESPFIVLEKLLFQGPTKVNPPKPSADEKDPENVQQEV